MTAKAGVIRRMRALSGGGTLVAFVRRMTTKHHIVVGFDTSELAGRALEAAILHAAGVAPATVHVVRALALMPGVDEDAGAAHAQLARLDYQAEALRETVEKRTLPTGVTIVTHVNVGEPASILADVVQMMIDPRVRVA